MFQSEQGNECSLDLNPLIKNFYTIPRKGTQEYLVTCKD